MNAYFIRARGIPVVTNAGTMDLQGNVGSHSHVRSAYRSSREPKMNMYQICSSWKFGFLDLRLPLHSGNTRPGEYSPFLGKRRRFEARLGRGRLWHSRFLDMRGPCYSQEHSRGPWFSRSMQCGGGRVQSSSSAEAPKITTSVCNHHHGASSLLSSQYTG